MKKNYAILNYWVLLSFFFLFSTQIFAGNVKTIHLDGNKSFGINESSSNNALDVSSAWTFEAWVNIGSYVSGDFECIMDRRTVFSLFLIDDASATADYAVRFVARDGTNIAASLRCDDANTASMQFDTWYHVAATFDGTTANLYINETSYDSNTDTDWNLTSSTNALNIGGRHWGSYTRQLSDAHIDEVRVSNTAKVIGAMQTNISAEEYIVDANTVLVMHLDDEAISPSYETDPTINLDGTTFNDDITSDNYVNPTNNLLRPKYQTNASGNWGDPATWQYYNGTSSSFVDAISSPNYFDSTINILNTHTVIVNSDIGINQVTVEAGATVSIASGKLMTLHTSTSNGIIIEGDVTVDGTLTVNSGSTLSVISNASNQGSLINNGVVNGDADIECYVTSGQWHGISSPVLGQTANKLYLNGNPEVWMKSYNEDRSYTYVTDLATTLDDMKGWMLYVEAGASNQTFSYSGALRTGTISPTDGLVRSQDGENYGFNFVGNPFTSAIDWDATSGWTKSNIANATYVYNNGNWDTYVNGTGTNDGSQYIAMNQGFFVQVSDGFNNGTLQMTSQVCVHNDVSFKNTNTEQQLIRLQLTDNNLTDETVIRITNEATQGWDGNLDAHKLFSFNDDYPQIYSTANGFMSINSLPESVETIPLDVVGADGNQMTISATEFGDFAEVLLFDEYLDEITDLTKEDYNFIYLNSITNRFFLSFLTTNIEEETNIIQRNFYAYSSNKEIKVVLENSKPVTISIYNLLGQEIITKAIHSTESSFAVDKPGYYIVKVSDGKFTETQKVIIK